MSRFSQRLDPLRGSSQLRVRLFLSRRGVGVEVAAEEAAAVGEVAAAVVEVMCSTIFPLVHSLGQLQEWLEREAPEVRIRQQPPSLVLVVCRVSVLFHQRQIY